MKVLKIHIEDSNTNYTLFLFQPQTGSNNGLCNVILINQLYDLMKIDSLVWFEMKKLDVFFVLYDQFILLECAHINEFRLFVKQHSAVRFLRRMEISNCYHCEFNATHIHTFDANDSAIC